MHTIAIVVTPKPALVVTPKPKMSDASTPIRSMKRKLTMSADPVTAGQLKLNWLKAGAKAYCMKDNINFVDRKVESGALIMMIEFQEMQSGQTWDIPEHIHECVAELEGFRIQGDSAILSRFSQVNGKPPRLFIFIDFPKDLNLTMQTVLKFVKAQDPRDGAFHAFLRGAVNGIEYVEDEKDYLVVSRHIIRHHLVSKCKESGFNGVPVAGTNLVRIVNDTDSDKAITLDNLKVLAKKYSVEILRKPNLINLVP